MIGWRYNLEKEVIELCAYYHNRKTCGHINFYFGGNEAASQDVSVQMELIEDV